LVRFVTFSLVLVLSWGVLDVPTVYASAVGATSSREFQFFREAPRACDFDMKTLDGTQVRLDALKGKVVILNFWRQNCQWCHLEKRYLRTLVHSLRKPDLKVVCANLWDQPGWVRRYAEKEQAGLVFTTRGDNSQSVVQNVVRGRLMGYYVVNGAREAIYEVKGFPTSYIIDKDGRVLATHVGMVRWDSPSIVQWIAGLVGDEKKETTIRSAGDPSPEWLDRLMTTDTKRR